MDWLTDIIKKNPFFALVFPTGLGGMDFFVHLFNAMSDGNIDPVEMQQLITSASGLQIVLLLVIMLALKEKKKK